MRSLAARNQWGGRVRRVRLEAEGGLAEVILDCDGREVVAVIARQSADRLGLREGEYALAAVKGTNGRVEP